MKRLALLIVVLAAAFVPAAGAAAPASVSISEINPSTTVQFHFRRDGYLVFVESEGESGRRLDLTVARHGASAAYLVRSQVKGRSVKAGFGRFGSVDMTFVPSPGHTRRCGSIVTSTGAFKGDLEFTGEHRYLHFDVHRVAGELTTAGTCSSDRRVGARRATGSDDEKTDGVTLTARTPGPGPYAVFSALGERSAQGFDGIAAGFRIERRDGVEVIRGSQLGLGGARFAWDLAKGTATVRPPAPFSGSARFRRGPGGPPRWSGSLRVPILGGRPLRLAGPRFAAHLRAGASGLARTVRVGSGGFQLP